jgi:hypothetical protein
VIARRLLVHAAAFACAAAWACASPSMPPGGPPDKAEPVVVRVTPESGAVNVRASSVLFRFDEVVSEGTSRTGQATSGLQGLVVVSPGDGRERVHWRRSAIEVEPRGGFRANTAYRVTLLPGLADLRGNVLSQPSEIVFSTGPTIPEGRIGGAIFDWGAGRVAPLAWVQAFRRPDSTLRWSARADSSGRYALRDLAPGAYTVRAFIDQNQNRRLDERESFDSLTVTIAAAADTATTDFYAFAHDTIGPRIEVVEPVDSVALRIRFDRPAAVDWVPDSTSSFVLQRADSSVVPLGEILPAARLDSILGVERARADSIARAADTTARADTVPRPATPVRPVIGDTAAARGPRMARPVPVQTWAVRLPAVLLPGTYKLRAVSIPGLGGTRRSSDREFTIRAPAPRDTVTPPRDTTRTRR